jgi:hypothetical protein
MKTRFALVALGMLILGGTVAAHMHPCAIAISHCWTGAETTATLDDLFRR